MQRSDTILWNGNLTEREDFSLSITNRAYKYGDGLFETIKLADGLPLFYRSHHSRLVRGLDALGMHIPKEFSFIYFRKKILELVDATKIKNGCLRLQAYRSGSGNYLPENSQFDWVAELTPTSGSEFYEFVNTSYKLGVFEELKKTPSKLSFFKSSNAQLYIQAALFAKQNQLENTVILNHKNHVIETIAENIFLYQNGTVYFPPISDGPIEGVMRSVVKKILIWNKIPFVEQSITLKNIMNAEEMFLTNVMKGILPVTHLKDKCFETNFIIGLQAKLNERVAQILSNKEKH